MFKILRLRTLCLHQVRASTFHVHAGAKLSRVLQTFDLRKIQFVKKKL